MACTPWDLRKLRGYESSVMINDDEAAVFFQSKLRKSRPKKSGYHDLYCRSDLTMILTVTDASDRTWHTYRHDIILLQLGKDHVNLDISICSPHIWYSTPAQLDPHKNHKMCPIEHHDSVGCAEIWLEYVS